MSPGKKNSANFCEDWSAKNFPRKFLPVILSHKRMMRFLRSLVCSNTPMSPGKKNPANFFEDWFPKKIRRKFPYR
jgi:hypothetical protein